MRYDGKNLILLFGLPRSGTTWIGKIFDSHPDVVYRHEPEAIFPIKEVPFHIPASEVDRYRKPLRDYVSTLLSMSHPRVAGKRPLLPKNYLGPVRSSLHKASLTIATLGARLSLSLPVYNPANRLPPDETPIAWKSVVGLGRLPALLHALPEAKAIIIHRHPCGYVASLNRGHKSARFGEHPNRSATVAPLFDWQRSALRGRFGLTDEDMDNLTVEERFAWRWVINHELLFASVKDLPNCIWVRYEDLCANPLEGYHELFAFCGLKWPKNTEHFLSDTINHDDTGYYSVFKNPSSSATRWQQELSSSVIEQVMTIVKRSQIAAQLLSNGPDGDHGPSTTDDILGSNPGRPGKGIDDATVQPPQ